MLPLKESTLSLLLILTFFSLKGQQEFRIKEIGTPFIKTYEKVEYGGHAQNWGIAQDQEGLIYVANTDAIIEYDGTNWKVIPHRNQNVVRSVCDCNGKMYVGINGDIGVLKSDPIGTHFFNSFLDKVPTEFRDFKHPYDAKCTSHGMYFRTYDALYKYDFNEDTVFVSPAEARFQNISEHKDIVYTWDTGRGLVAFDETSEAVVLPKKDPDLTAYETVHFSGDTFLINTNKGLYKWSNESFEKWEIPLTNQIESRVYRVLGIKGSYFALATLGQGIFIIDKKGVLVQHINEEVGLASDIAYSMFLDGHENLWVGTGNGISVVHINSPFSLLDERHGVDGSMIHIASHQGNLYAGGYSGLFYHDKTKPWQSIGKKPFQKMEGVDDASWLFVNHDNDLLLGTIRGLVQIKEDKTSRVFKGNHLWAVLQMKEKNSVIMGSNDGNYYLFNKTLGQWAYKWKIEGIDLFVDFMEEEEDGTVWLTDSGTGIFRFKLNEKMDAVEWIHKYGIEKGLPDSVGNRVFRHENGLKFLTKKGIHIYDQENDIFQPDPTFKETLGETQGFRFVETRKGHVFFAVNEIGKGILKRQTDGSFEMLRRPFKKIDHFNSEYVWTTDDDNIMVANSDGLLHYDVTYPIAGEAAFNSNIRKVEVISPNDSLVFGGTGANDGIQLPFANNALRFGYSATYYEEPDKTEYQYLLDGFDESWSEWSSASTKEYTNLSQGNYLFRVRARNLYGDISKEDTFSLKILPPWYLQWWAFFLYTCLLLTLIWIAVKINSIRLKAENLRLEAVIKQRTSVITEQKEQAEQDRNLIQQQAEQLRELDEAKTKFFSNISHEFRTPLTLIQGPLENLLSKKVKKEDLIEQNLKIAHRNSETLRKLIDEVLDFNKIESGDLTLFEKPVFLKDFLAELITNYKYLCEQSNIGWSFEGVENKELILQIDSTKLEHILNNLVSNAVKHASSKISLDVRFENGELVGVVSDDGRGIAEEELPLIFNRFYQTSHGAQMPHSSGIGLAYAKEVLEIMGGQLKVDSTIGEGTVFQFQIPVTTLSVEEISVDEEISIEPIQAPFSHDNNKILIVEDNPEMQNFIRQIFSKEFELEVAGNGQEALSKLESFQADLLISDVMMPVMDGLELLKTLKESKQWKFLSFVMLTARKSEELKLEALYMGLDDYLTKPFSPIELEIRVKNLLNNQFERLKWRNKEEDDKIEREDDPLITDLVSEIGKNITNRNFGVVDLSNKASLSDRQLTRVVKRSTGLTPATMIREVKLQKAKHYLETKKFRSVAEVTYSVGYEKPSYFSKIFFERYGKKPSEYFV